MVKGTRDEGRSAAAVMARIGNAVASAADRLRASLPGKRPRWVVMDVEGSYPARKPRRKGPSRFLRLGPASQTLEDLERQVDLLLRAPWVEGVLFRLTGPRLGLTTALAMRRQLDRLRAGGKRVEVLAHGLDNATYLLASGASRIVVPESAELAVNGLSLTASFLGDALGRHGVRFDKLAIREYKNAGDQLARASMSEAQREQYGAFLDSVTITFTASVAERRGVSAQAVRGWVDEGVTSARRAVELGMIDAVAYEDEVVGSGYGTLAAAARFAPSARRSTEPKRVALVSLEGTIVPGHSRKSPVPLPLFGEVTAGSETVVRALRAAGRDKRTAAVVFHVDSGGGSALASDLIWREVKLLAERMPVVAVMGAVAGSGGYYVLTHATRVMAEATTLTGSIGVVMMKAVMQELYERQGINVETIERGRFSAIMDSSRPFDDAERALMERQMTEVYERFVARVAEGRKLSPERVNEIGRGRIWSGADALGIGLVDELGDLPLAIARAKELAGLGQDASVWTVEAPSKYLLPKLDDPSAWLPALAPLLRERAWLLQDVRVTLR